MNRHLKMVLIAGVAACALATGCVPQQKFTDLWNRNRRAQDELKDATERLKSLEADNANLGETVEFVDFVNHHPPSLILSNCSFLEGQEYRERSTDAKPISPDCFVTSDWAALGVDITKELLGRERQ